MAPLPFVELCERATGVGAVLARVEATAAWHELNWANTGGALLGVLNGTERDAGSGGSWRVVTSFPKELSTITSGCAGIGF